MRELMKVILPQPVVTLLQKILATAGGTYLRTSYSQEGEDLILERILGHKKAGFYIDVGAHHPRRFSNTCRFYQRGWRGINIEPNPEALKLFQQKRKRDINLGFGIAKGEDHLTYFMFNEPALNSFDRAAAEQRQNSKYRIVGTKSIAVRPLANILNDYMPDVQIDFMSIDVEGYDLQVLESNDWARFRPTLLLVEATHFNLASPTTEPIHIFLEDRDYKLFAKTLNTLFYVDRRKADGENSVALSAASQQ
jgi:FkbM family methyltransferase